MPSLVDVGLLQEELLMKVTVLICKSSIQCSSNFSVDTLQEKRR